MSYAFGAPIVRSRGTLWPGVVLVAGLLACLVLPAAAQAQPVPQDPPAVVQAFAVPDLPDETGEASWSLTPPAASPAPGGFCGLAFSGLPGGAHSAGMYCAFAIH